MGRLLSDEPRTEVPHCALLVNVTAWRRRTAARYNFSFYSVNAVFYVRRSCTPNPKDNKLMCRIQIGIVGIFPLSCNDVICAAVCMEFTSDINQSINQETPK